jgi:hypothetical protein
MMIRLNQAIYFHREGSWDEELGNYGQEVGFKVYVEGFN